MIVIERDENERLIHPVALIAIVIVVCVVLFILFPEKEVFQDPQFIDNPDSLSIAYLNVLLETDPENLELRLVLAKQLQKTGQINEASIVLEVVAKILDGSQANDGEYTEDVLIDAHKVYIAQRIIQNQIKLEDNDIVIDQELVVLADRLLLKNWPVSEKFHMFNGFSNFLQESTQRHVLETLQEQSKNDFDTLPRINKALARSYLASGKVEDATNVYEQIFKTEEDVAKKRSVALDWVKIALESGNPHVAYVAVRKILNVYPNDLEFLDIAYDIGLQTNHIHEATEWLEGTWIKTGEINRLKKLFDLRLSSGDLKASSKLADRLANFKNIEPALRKKMALLYSWIGNHEKSLAQWLIYAKATPDEESKKSILYLYSLYSRYDEMIALLQEEREKGKLSIAEYLELSRLRVKVGDVDTVDDLLFEAILKFPGNSDLYLTQYKVLKNQERFEEAARIYGLLKSQFPVSIIGITEQAKMLWDQRSAPEALRELQSFNFQKNDAENINVAIEYWLVRAELAAYLDNTKELYSSYDQILALIHAEHDVNGIEQSRIKSVFRRVVDMALRRQEYSKALKLMEWEYKRTGEIEFIQRALIYALADNDFQGVERILKEFDRIRSNHAFDNTLKAQLWAARAQLFGSKGDLLSSNNAWLKAIELSPKERAYREAWLWLLIEDSHKDLLQAALDDPVNHFAIEQQAYGRQMLGDHNGALYWFARGFTINQHRWTWLYAMSNTMDQIGYSDKSFQLRERALELMASSIKLDNEDVSNNNDRVKTQFLRLYGQIHDKSGAELQAKRTFYQNMSDKNRLVLAMESALSNNQTLLIEHYQHIATLQGMELPGWQQLSIALRKDSFEHIRNILNSYKELPISDKTVALNNAVGGSEALSYGLETLSEQLSEIDRMQLRRVTAPLRAKHDNGFKLLTRLFEIGDISVFNTSATFAISKDIAGNLVDFKLIRDHFAFDSSTSNGQTLISDLSEQADFKAQFEYFVSRGNHPKGSRISFEALLHTRKTGNTPGLVLNYGYTGNEALTSEIQLAWQIRSGISSSIYAAGYANKLSYDLKYSFDSRNTLSGKLSFDAYSTEKGSELGRGYSWLLSAKHQIFLADPAWTVSATHQGLSYDRSEEPNMSLQPYFTQPANSAELVSNDAILPTSYNRTSIGTHIFHGSLHELTRAVPSPRYTLSSDLGFNWDNQTVDFGIDAGIGWRITGDDELAFSVRWNSDSASGEDRTTLSVSYINSLSR